MGWVCWVGNEGGRKGTEGNEQEGGEWGAQTNLCVYPDVVSGTRLCS